MSKRALRKRIPCKTVKHVFHHNNSIRIMRTRKTPIAVLVVFITIITEINCYATIKIFLF